MGKENQKGKEVNESFVISLIYDGTKEDARWRQKICECKENKVTQNNFNFKRVVRFLVKQASYLKMIIIQY